MYREVGGRRKIRKFFFGHQFALESTKLMTALVTKSISIHVGRALAVQEIRLLPNFSSVSHGNCFKMSPEWSFSVISFQLHVTEIMNKKSLLETTVSPTRSLKVQDPGHLTGRLSRQGCGLSPVECFLRRRAFFLLFTMNLG